MDYPRIEELGIKIHDNRGVDPTELKARLIANELDSDLFDKMFGCQSCPIVNDIQMLYPHDTEAVLERMMSGKLTGTQLIWD